MPKWRLSSYWHKIICELGYSNTKIKLNWIQNKHVHEGNWINLICIWHIVHFLLNITTDLNYSLIHIVYLIDKLYFKQHLSQHLRNDSPTGYCWLYFHAFCLKRECNLLCVSSCKRGYKRTQESIIRGRFSKTQVVLVCYYKFIVLK